MAKAFSGKKPQHFGNTIRVFLNYPYCYTN